MSIDEISKEQEVAIDLLQNKKVVSVTEEYGYRYWLWTPPTCDFDREIRAMLEMNFTPGNMPGEWMELPLMECEDIASMDKELWEIFVNNEWKVNVDD